jgi:hypothetical protein
LFILAFGLSACGESESEIAKKIKLQVSSGSIVLPNKLAGAESDNPGTCLDQDVTGPRVRIRTSIIWDGGVEYGNLVPYILQFSLENTPVGSYVGSIGPRGEFESMGYFFGATTDFIPPDGQIYTSTRCFADFGGLPAPSPKLTGRRELVVRGKILLSGVTRTTIANTEKGAGVELPFAKEVETEIVYTAGSVPATQ